MDARREWGDGMGAHGGSAARVVTFFPRYCTDQAVAHTCFSLARWVRSEGLSHRMVVTQGSERVVGEPWVTAAVPAWVGRAGYKARLGRAMSRWAEVVLLRSLGDGEAVWLWPGARLGLIETLKRRGHTVVTERINCHRATARRILDEAYAELGLRPRHGLLPELEMHERRELELVDWVFSPSPNVTASLVEEGVAPGKVLASSYGWDPARMSRVVEGDGEARRREGFTALFVGRICVRKGAHLLLRAWAALGEAGVRGRLVLMGRLDEEIARVCARELAREDVEVRPFGADVGSAYAGADVFVLPTLEEGSPLVVYEALASGLPVVTTRMGAGSVVRDGVEGMVVGAGEVEGLVGALRAYAVDEERRREAGVLARVRSREYTWSRVGQRRAAQLVGVLRGGAGVREAAGRLMGPRRVGVETGRAGAERVSTGARG